MLKIKLYIYNINKNQMASLLKKNESIELSKRRMRFSAHDTSYSSANSQRIRINVDTADEHIDFESSYLVFQIAVSGGTTDVGLNRYAASSWIREIRFKDRAGNQIGENLQNYNVMCRTHYEQKATLDQEKSYLDAIEGAQGVTLSGQGDSIAATQYAHRFITHIGAMKNYFPAKYLGGIIIEIDMEQSNKVVLQTSGESGATYTISDLAFVGTLIKLKPEVESVLVQQLQKGLTIDYTSTHTIIANESTSTSQRFDLGTQNGRVKNIQTISNPTKANQSVDELNTFSRNNLSNYRYKLGSRYLTESQVEVSATKQAEYLMEYLISQKLQTEPYGLYGNENLTKTVLAGGSTGGKFVVGQNADRSKSDAVLSSLKDKDHNRLELNRNYSSAPTANILYTFVSLDKRMMIMPGKQFVDNDFSGEGTFMET